MTTSTPTACRCAPQTDDGPALLTPDALAGLLAVAPRTLRRMSTSGQLGPMPLRIASRLRWRKDEIMAWLAADAPGRAAWQALRTRTERRVRA